jgi:hypothetical protein
MIKTKWMAVTAGVASGLALAASAQAQGVTGGQYLSDINPANIPFISGAWNAATITSTPQGLSISAVPSGSFSQLYYPFQPGQQSAVDTAATSVTLNYYWTGTVNPIAGAGVAVVFALDDSLGGANYYSTGYLNHPTPGLNTATFALQAANQANIAAGAVINGLSFQVDAGNVSSPTYDITFSSLTLEPQPVPEPTTLALAGLGAAGMLALRRRK